MGSMKHLQFLSLRSGEAFVIGNLQNQWENVTTKMITDFFGRCLCVLDHIVKNSSREDGNISDTSYQVKKFRDLDRMV